MIKINKDVFLECERLNKNDLFSTIKNVILGDTVAVLVHNMKLLPRYIGYILSSKRIIYNDIIGFTETQIKSLDSTWEIVETLNLFSIVFNINNDKVSSLANGCRNDVTVSNKFYANRVSILNFFLETSFCQRSIQSIVSL